MARFVPGALTRAALELVSASIAPLVLGEILGHLQMALVSLKNDAEDALVGMIGCSHPPDLLRRQQALEALLSSRKGDILRVAARLSPEARRSVYESLQTLLVVYTAASRSLVV